MLDFRFPSGANRAISDSELAKSRQTGQTLCLINKIITEKKVKITLNNFDENMVGPGVCIRVNRPRGSGATK